MFTSYVASQVALESHHHHTQSGNNTSNLNPFTRCQECMIQEGGADSCEEECSNDD